MVSALRSVDGVESLKIEFRELITAIQGSIKDWIIGCQPFIRDAFHLMKFAFKECLLAINRFQFGNISSSCFILQLLCRDLCAL